jgi:uncharacterized protein (TIGR02145 family)
MSYQAVIRNPNNVLVKNSLVGIKISILPRTVSGGVIYAETHTVTTNSDGLVSLEIGGGTVVSGTFPINWANGPYYLGVEIDPEGGTNYTISGMSQLLNVPYAFYAKTAETSIDAVKTTGDQIIAGNKTFSGTITVAAPLNATDAATKAYVDGILDKVLQIQADLGAKDFDGNAYNAVKIGKQVWMTENLKTTKYKDGTSIPLVTDSPTWGSLSTPAYCWYNEDKLTYENLYGALYNWYAVNTGKLCPSGWHVPSNVEWTSLTTYLGGDSVAGDKLKESGSIHWVEPNTGATNESGFTALPSGGRVLYGDNWGFYNISNNGFWWSSNEYSTTLAWQLFMSSFQLNVNIGWSAKENGYSIRCLKDN